VSARTIRLIRRALPLIDEEFRQNPRHHRLFMDIMRAPEGVTHELRRMSRYGVLGRYIPAFGRVTGRMQFDLFHAYTVDAHTLFVVSNLRRFALSRFDHEMPMCSRIMQSLPKPELAYLAGLFHDIAKGRGGDHSELGAVDAESFCLEHGLSTYDARLVAWLVRHHLVFSITAQKKDIHDPAVVAEFARRVGDEAHLDYLYVLTVADVRGTSPKLWNAWKASLFEEFYDSVKRALRAGLESPIDSEQLIAETQEGALGAAPLAGHPRRARARGLGRLRRRVLPAPHAGRDRLAHPRAGRPRGSRRAVRRVRGTADRPRRHLHHALHPERPAQLRARHRRARRAGPEHSRRARGAGGRRAQRAHLRGAGERRLADR
jgi:[protein-PII] uridylyltransferase